jgi:hypothetical protein
MMCRTIVAGVALSVLLAIPVRAADQPTKEAAMKKAASELVVPAKKVTFLDAKHFINKWLMVGPITFGENEFGGGEQTSAADKEFIPKEAELDGTQAAPKGAKWEAKDFSGSSTPGEIDLGTAEHAVTYAVAWVNCPEAVTNAKLMVGSDDYIKVWINGKLVHTYKAGSRAGEADQDSVSGINLNKGENRIVVKCVNALGAWNFYLRFADKDDKAYALKTAAPAK